MVISSILISITAILLSMWIGRKNPVRSSSLTAGMVILLMVTPLLLLLPKIEVSWLTQALTNQAELSSTTASTGSAWWVWSLWSLYLIVSAVILLRLFIHCFVIKKWCREAEITYSVRDLQLIEQCSEQLEFTKIPELRYTRHLQSPVITGLLNPILLLPMTAKTWNTETLKMVMLHELGHVQRRDLWSSMAAQIACAFHWFNPLVWILRKRLLSECEYACDAHVIAHGTNAKTYIHALCDVAESCRLQHQSAPMATLAMADKASLKHRVENVLGGGFLQSKSNHWIVLGILTLSVTATLGFTLVRPQVLEKNQITKVGEEPESQAYDAKEINTRLNANPFPED